MNNEDWLKTEKLKLTIKEHHYHHHAYEIINSNPNIKNYFVTTLNQSINIKPRIKYSKQDLIQTEGINANDLNVQIRKLLKNNNTEIDLKLEVLEENGVFYFATEKNAIGGFDFAILNNEINLTSLRNLCFGDLQYANAEERWKKFIDKNPELYEVSQKILQTAPKGINIEKKRADRYDPLIVGEIQFGNWALAYRDFFKVLKADVQNNIDCLIYIVPCGRLERYLSEGIVTFDKTLKIINDFSKVINVPVWLIGIDVEDNA